MAYASKRDEYVAPIRQQRIRRCKCGVCKFCQEEARWERIFKEKFEDPTYYSRGTVHRGPGSSLANL
jgi:hypothetical protein